MLGTDPFMDPEILIKDYEGLVRSFVAKYKNKSLSQEDLFQEGIFGLLEANMRFDPERETQFATYAHFWIKKRILLALKREIAQNSEHSTYHDDLARIQAPEAEHKTSDMSLPDDMPELERDILRLSYAERLPLLEIAKRTKLRPERIKQIRSNALRRLRLFYKEYKSIH